LKSGVVGYIDSLKGGIRVSFEGAPDAPLSRVIVDMQGGKKGLIVNSKNLCYKPGKNSANAKFTGQNGKRRYLRPVVRASCHKKRRVHRGRHRRHVRHR
jgi:hypothetical protein